jgi:hypothetical protein
MKVSMKNVFIIVPFILVFAIVTLSQTEAPTKSYDRIPANTAKHFSYPYYLYVPPELETPEAKEAKHTLLVIPNNTGKISDDFSVHEADAMRRMAQVPGMVAGLKVAVLMPVFPRPESDWKIYTHGLDRDASADAQTGISQVRSSASGDDRRRPSATRPRAPA